MAIRRAVALVASGVLALASAAAPAAESSLPQQEFTIGDPRITESSGLTASIAHPGVYWTHNDSGDGPYVYAVDAHGRTVARITLRGVELRDAEAVSLGPDGQLYLADIGDNLDGSRSEVWIYRFAEPEQLEDRTVDAVRYRVRYEDGPRNAEALMVHPRTGRAYIAGKHEQNGHLYQGTEELSPTGVNTFRRVADVPWVTDGAFSPDGTRLVLRGYFWANSYRWRDASADPIEPLGSVDVPFQRQGESVTFAPDGRSVLFGSEGKDSAVWRVPLRGDQLPDTVAESGSPAASAAPSGPAVPSGQGQQAAAGAASRLLGLGLFVLAAALMMRKRRRRAG
ncbi:hypothetical protein ACFC1R_04110 [Kitasatospora sp. NPDC056138]|uniref:hypothetical protein n=1 Tax=Kitasatospora sp. NPDC056138 TaxID=3345724 RepID=UPI0035D714C0